MGRWRSAVLACLSKSLYVWLDTSEFLLACHVAVCESEAMIVTD